jgi:hypothetical protein
VLLAVLVGLTGGVVLTATAGARRTDSAYGRFLAASRAADLLVSPNNTGFGGYYRALAALPGAETVAPVIGLQALPVLPGRKLVEAQVYTPADGRLAHAIERPRILEGRLPNPARVHELALDERAAQKLHAGIGSTVTLAAIFSTAPGQPVQGLRMFHQKVVGLFLTRDNPVPINALAQLPVVYTTHAFYDQLGGAYRSFDGAYLRLRPGISALRFDRQAEAMAKRYPSTGGGVFVANLSDQAAQVERAIRPEAFALGLFGLVIALTGVVLLAQAILRQLRSSRTDFATLRALGLTDRKIVVRQPPAGGSRGGSRWGHRRRCRRVVIPDHAGGRCPRRGTQPGHQCGRCRPRPRIRHDDRPADRGPGLARVAAELGGTLGEGRHHTVNAQAADLAFERQPTAHGVAGDP